MALPATLVAPLTGVVPVRVVTGFEDAFAFAAQAARILAAQGIRALLCERDTPTPVVASDRGGLAEVLGDAALRQRMGSAGLELVAQGQGSLARTLEHTDRLLAGGCSPKLLQ